MILRNITFILIGFSLPLCFIIFALGFGSWYRKRNSWDWGSYDFTMKSLSYFILMTENMMYPTEGFWLDLETIYGNPYHTQQKQKGWMEFMCFCISFGKTNKCCCMNMEEKHIVAMTASVWSGYTNDRFRWFWWDY